MGTVIKTSGTVADALKRMLCDGGLSEVAGATIYWKDGSQTSVSSEDHPALSRPADDVKEIKPRRSAEGG